MGFLSKWENFQPLYIFSKRHETDLRVGNAILREFVNKEAEIEERARLAKENEKAAKEAAAERVKLAFIDDRLSKAQADERDALARAARATRAPAAPVIPAVTQETEDDEEGSPEPPEPAPRPGVRNRRSARRGPVLPTEGGHVLGSRSDQGPSEPGSLVPVSSAPGEDIDAEMDEELSPL